MNALTCIHVPVDCLPYNAAHSTRRLKAFVFALDLNMDNLFGPADLGLRSSPANANGVAHKRQR